jgi:hypothetical protein
VRATLQGRKAFIHIYIEGGLLIELVSAARGYQLGILKHYAYEAKLYS